jgi:hypothetical protein
MGNSNTTSCNEILEETKGKINKQVNDIKKQSYQDKCNVRDNIMTIFKQLPGMKDRDPAMWKKFTDSIKADPILSKHLSKITSDAQKITETMVNDPQLSACLSKALGIQTTENTEVIEDTKATEITEATEATDDDDIDEEIIAAEITEVASAVDAL